MVQTGRSAIKATDDGSSKLKKKTETQSEMSIRASLQASGSGGSLWIVVDRCGSLSVDRWLFG